MSATLTTPALPFLGAGAEDPRVEGGAGGAARPRRLTLEERLNRSLAELRAAGMTECPLCHAPMRPSADGGECSGCGSRLS